MSLSRTVSTKEGLWLEMIRAGESLNAALEAEYQLMNLKQQDVPEQALYRFRKARETVELCAKNYVAALRAWRIAVLEAANTGTQTARRTARPRGLAIQCKPA